MFFLGAQIPQDEHGRCTLLSNRTASLQTTQLQASTQRILTRSRPLHRQQALHVGTAARAKRTRVISTRERDLCQQSIGES